MLSIFAICLGYLCIAICGIWTTVEVVYGLCQSGVVLYSLLK